MITGPTTWYNTLTNRLGGNFRLILLRANRDHATRAPCHTERRISQDEVVDHDDVVIVAGVIGWVTRVLVLSRPHRVVNAYQPRRLIGDELDETEVAKVCHAPAGHGRRGRAEYRIARVIADPDQHVERLRRQALHLAQGAIFQPGPPAHEAGRYTRTASASGMPPPGGPRAASSASR